MIVRKIYATTLQLEAEIGDARDREREVVC